MDCGVVPMKSKLGIIIFNIFIIALGWQFAGSQVHAAITEQQGLDVAEFARNFIEQGNARRDEKGFPLLTYALSGNWNTCIEIRNKGYNEELYEITRNSYYFSNGKYLNLGNKWCMDCGTFVTYMLKKTLGVVLYNGKEPWHVQDIYNDARKGEKSQYFEFVYASVAVGKIDYQKLQPGDVIARISPGGNHGMLYLGDGMIAHANRDMITYRAPAVSGFQVSKLNHYYLSGTVVRVMRIKDGIVPTDYVVNDLLTWPDTGETVSLIAREQPAPEPEVEEPVEEDPIQEPESISGEKLFEKNKDLQDKLYQEIRIKPLMLHSLNCYHQACLFFHPWYEMQRLQES